MKIRFKMLIFLKVTKLNKYNATCMFYLFFFLNKIITIVKRSKNHSVMFTDIPNGRGTIKCLEKLMILSISKLLDGKKGELYNLTLLTFQLTFNS